jgi:hypothetical protein
MKQPRLVFALLVLVMFGWRALAQPPERGNSRLPVSRIVLFSSGVGYFQREGIVDGNARVDLQFHSSDINDLLKSLILEDAGGGLVGTVNYDSRAPVELTLKSFAIDLTQNPSLGQLLGQVRGERVEIVPRLPQRDSMKGIIVGTERSRGAGKTGETEVETALLRRADLRKGIEPKPFKEALDQLRDLFGVTILINEAAFREDLQQDDVESVTVKLPGMSGATLDTVLRLLMAQIKGGAYVVHRDHLEITSEARAATRQENAPVDNETLNLLTDQGLESIGLDRIQRVRFLKPELEKEFRKALEVLALVHDRQKKTVSLNFTGNGKRPVKVGYVSESPIWKTSYRLAIDKDAKVNKAFLQGWAIVENTTDEDWNEIGLGLVSGRPISFEMDLYEPLYVPRPTVEPDLFASLRPQAYDAAIDQVERQMRRSQTGGQGGPEALGGVGQGLGIGAGLGALGQGLGFGGGGQGALGGGFGGGGGRGVFGGGLGVGAGGQVNLGAGGGGQNMIHPANRPPIDLSKSVASAAVATALGEHFQYQIEQPVSLARQKAALLPIVNQAVETSKVSIYDEAVHAKYPLLGLRFKNTTGLHLMQGPITIYEGNSYAGDARIGDMQPKETRLVSYAVDLGTEVVPEVKEASTHAVAVKIVKGVVHTMHKLRQAKRYTIKNRSEHPRLILVEHPYQADWTLVGHRDTVERSRDAYRFEVNAGAGESAKLDVAEEKSQPETVAVGTVTDQSIQILLQSTVLGAKVREAFREILGLRQKLAQTREAIAADERVLKDIEKDQERMRANMAGVPPTSEAYKRYLKKFDDQETQIEQRQAAIARLRDEAGVQRHAYETFIAALNVE